ncbi:hypothetical protein HMPREF3190_00869 [Umbribacter vaginalis]|nr:hypothetical protein HMPREF3190_00869 [Coriobacteriales bacterium DNF00809]
MLLCCCCIASTVLLNGDITAALLTAGQWQRNCLHHCCIAPLSLHEFVGYCSITH